MPCNEFNCLTERNVLHVQVCHENKKDSLLLNVIVVPEDFC